MGGGRLALSAAVWGNNKLGNATATLVAPTAVAGNGARGSEGGRLSRAAEGHTPVTFPPPLRAHPVHAARLHRLLFLAALPAARIVFSCLTFY